MKAFFFLELGALVRKFGLIKFFRDGMNVMTIFICTHYFYCWSNTFTRHIFRKGCSVYFLPTFVVILARIFEKPATFVKHCTCTQNGFDLCVQNGQC